MQQILGLREAVFFGELAKVKARKLKNFSESDADFKINGL